MPVRKFRSVEEMERPVWRRPGDPGLYRVMAGLWDLGCRTSRRRAPARVPRGDAARAGALGWSVPSSSGRSYARSVLTRDSRVLGHLRTLGAGAGIRASASVASDRTIKDLCPSAPSIAFLARGSSKRASAWTSATTRCGSAS